MEFSASITRACALQMIHTTYVRTNVPTPPALCLGTPVPRQKFTSDTVVSFSTHTNDSQYPAGCLCIRLHRNMG